MLKDRMLTTIEERLRKAALPIDITFWDGRTIKPATPAEIDIAVRSPKALSSLVNPSMGKLARSYVEQDIDLRGDIRHMIKVGEAYARAMPIVNHKTGITWRKWGRHTRHADRKSIQYHYDVGNDFYALWLDKRRVYSCAYFKNADDSLDIAQEQKLDHICRKLRLKQGDYFLDIGCGWGALILWAVQNYNVRALGITLSDEQHQHVQQQIKELGLQDRCEVRLCDYRDVEGLQFDKISSVGMFEHVGQKNLPIYFEKIYQLLKPGGVVMNHGITSASLDAHGLGSGIREFIDDYVFPDGQLVHVSEVIRSLSEQGLECWDAECLRPHYAKTLWHWVDRLDANAEAARTMVGEKKFRIWRIYMAGSAHAFERGWLSLFQILATKPLSNGSIDYPLTREHVYR